MRYIIASDIHGSEQWCSKLLKAFDREKADKLVLLGDILYHGPRNDLPEVYLPKKVIADLNAVKDSIYICMKGNCDAEVDEMVLNFPMVPGVERIELNGVKLYATHGHRFNAEADGSKLPEGFKSGDVLLHGHTHIPAADRVKAGDVELTLLNPGSTSIPKGGFPNSYAVFGDDLIFTVKDFNGNRLMSVSLE